MRALVLMVLLAACGSTLPNYDYAKEPGSGSAGGLGFGLLAFMGAKLEPGFALFARLAALQKRLRR